jgi:hypothetical protein
MDFWRTMLALAAWVKRQARVTRRLFDAPWINRNLLRVQLYQLP